MVTPGRRPLMALPAPAMVAWGMQLVLAPLMGITGPEFRRIYHRHFPWFDRALAPFISVTNGIGKSGPRFREILPAENSGSLPLEPQILGKEGRLFREVAGKIHQSYGYSQVNWNIGCPSSTVTARQRGSGILPHPELIDRFLAEAFDATPVRISVKTRLGFRDQAEWAAVAGVLQRYPLAELTIHPRTGRQQYTGQADRQAFKAAIAGFGCPILYNGDLRQPADAREILEACPGLAGLMLGRGALADPFLPGRLKGLDLPAPGSRDFMAALFAFHDNLAAEYLQSRHRPGTGQGNPGLMTARLKELWQYWAPAFRPQPEYASPSGAGPAFDGGSIPGPVKAILKTRTAQEYHDAVAGLRAVCLD